ncbi:glycosyltransferase family 1 protein [Hypomontagnella monticulosa]|nr:glycosyltransferase family 1 protein [Hypomontagnella monticulosa]
MAPQPQSSLMGQGSPQESKDGSPKGTSSSGNQFSQTHNTLTPTQTSNPASRYTQQPPLLFGAITAQTGKTPTLDREHQECIAKMDANHDTFINYTIRQSINDIVRPIAFLICGIFAGIGHISVVIGTAMFAIASTIAHGVGYGVDWGFGFFYYPALWILLVYIPIRHVMIASRRPIGKKLFKKFRPDDAPHYLLAICGSGGHTGEMLQMISASIRPEGPNAHRRWAIGSEDRVSRHKVLEFERGIGFNFAAMNESPGTFDIVYFTRARKVHQSWFTTPFSALKSLFDILRILTIAPEKRPDYRYPGVIVSDGPGTGFMFLLAAHILKIFRVVNDHALKTIFVESWARVETLSLSGKLVSLLHLADVFIVQNADLATRYNVTYTGNMVVASDIERLPSPEPQRFDDST